MTLRSETAYQDRLIKKLKQIFPGCFVLKNNPEDVQGIPDLLVLFGTHWAMLEVKISMSARVQPNQNYYVELFDQMSFAAFINPQNEEEVLDAIQHSFGLSW